MTCASTLFGRFQLLFPICLCILIDVGLVLVLDVTLEFTLDISYLGTMQDTYISATISAYCVKEWYISLFTSTVQVDIF